MSLSKIFLPFFTLTMLLPTLGLAQSTVNSYTQYKIISEIALEKKHTKEENAILPFYEKALADAKKNSPEKFQTHTLQDFLNIGLFDLNNDGIDEIFVWVQIPGECGVNLCELDIYQRDKDARVKLIESGIVHGPPNILESMSHGYHDLAYGWWDEGKEFYLILRWNGKHYELIDRSPINHVIGLDGVKETLWQK